MKITKTASESKAFKNKGEFEPEVHAHWKIKEPTHEFSE